MALHLGSYNDNIYAAALPPLDCNFNPDIEEARLPTKYPEEAPPSLPSATAAGFFPAFGSSSGEPSGFSPMAGYTPAGRREVVILSDPPVCLNG